MKTATAVARLGALPAALSGFRLGVASRGPGGRALAVCGG